MGGELRLRNVGDEPREVDEASYAAVGHRGRDGLGGHPVAVAEVAAVEGVDEVDDGVDVLDRLRHGGGVGDVAADRADPVVPAEAVGTRRGRRRGDDVVAVLEQVGDEARTDVAGGAQDEDRIRPRPGA